MDLGELTGLVAVFMGTSMLLIPIAGLTLRFAIKPAVEQIARALHEMNGGSRQEVSYRLQALEDQVSQLQSTLDHLESTDHFDRQLLHPDRR